MAIYNLLVFTETIRMLDQYLTPLAWWLKIVKGSNLAYSEYDIHEYF